MFAVVRTGGKQYRVAAGDKIVVEKIGGAAGETVSLGDVLFAGEGGQVRDVAGLTVSAEIIAQAKADKVIVFKKRRRHNYRRKNGHRQQHTILRITAIGDEQASGTTQGQPEAAPIAAAPQDDAAPKSRTRKAPASPAATEPQVQPPLKVDGAESAMTDSPVSTKSDGDQA